MASFSIVYSLFQALVTFKKTLVQPDIIVQKAALPSKEVERGNLYLVLAVISASRRVQNFQFASNALPECTTTKKGKPRASHAAVQRGRIRAPPSARAQVYSYLRPAVTFAIFEHVRFKTDLHLYVL